MSALSNPADLEKSNSARLHNTFKAIAPLTEQDVAWALPHFSFQKYSSKDTLFSCGDSVLDVHFLLDGFGRYYYIDSGGNERNKSLVRKGGAFTSVSSLIEGRPSPFYAQAITDCLVAAIRYEDLVALSKQHAIWGDFLRTIYERLVLKKEKREAGFLLLDAKARYEEFLIEFGEDSHRIPLRQVAMYIGVTDVTLSRIRREMGLT